MTDFIRRREEHRFAAGRNRVITRADHLRFGFSLIADQRAFKPLAVRNRELFACVVQIDEPELSRARPYACHFVDAPAGEIRQAVGCKQGHFRLHEHPGEVCGCAEVGLRRASLLDIAKARVSGGAPFTAGAARRTVISACAAFPRLPGC